ncbi:MAG: HhH-GPD family protein [Pelosinus sp.]|jgi:DNA-3-methyladenine glycosylase II|nr:HhH-GPD family protein [Pelosinus sp.]
MGIVKTKFFDYSQTEIDYLKSVDQILGARITQLGKVEREVIPDLFTALIYTIVGQQISVKAVHTIWNRMQDCFSEITPQNVASATVEAIQQCGLSTRKAGYIRSLSETIIRGDFDLLGLYELSDAEIIRRLSKLRGIGVWTAEMLLLNSMERPDVVSWGDLAIRRGMMNLYDLPEITKGQFEKYKRQYSPYGSVASIYLWKLSL